MALHPSFLTHPLTHRALHDVKDGRPENSRAAIRAAIDAGYGIEIDVQLSSDGQAMVFHDYSLGRLTGESGAVALRSAEELCSIPLTGGDGEGIPTLIEILELVGGAVPLLIEIKDQDGAMGPNVGPLERAVSDALMGYGGPVGVMSFNPHSVAEMALCAPSVPRGLTTSSWLEDDWPTIPADRRAELAPIPDYDRVGACFISHESTDLYRDRVTELKAAGAVILCWTIKSAEEERAARRIVDNVTFEQYLA
ncbi:glycerophosphodiester phosphodiesterase family protein [Marivivens marinus]|uniref:glycerophosphodiester phosphodiesterase family protein n=1 Tax=Marivivens marinus TaxID=3110173 RepID=UPI003B8491C8